MPLLPTLPEDSETATFDLSADPTDTVDSGEDDENGLCNQANIAGNKKSIELSAGTMDV